MAECQECLCGLTTQISGSSTMCWVCFQDAVGNCRSEEELMMLLKSEGMEHTWVFEAQLRPEFATTVECLKALVYSSLVYVVEKFDARTISKAIIMKANMGLSRWDEKLYI